MLIHPSMSVKEYELPSNMSIEYQSPDWKAGGSGAKGAWKITAAEMITDKHLIKLNIWPPFI